MLSPPCYVAPSRLSALAGDSYVGGYVACCAVRLGLAICARRAMGSLDGDSAALGAICHT